MKIFPIILLFLANIFAEMPSLSDKISAPVENEKFWEPLQISIQVNEGFFPRILSNHETYTTRQLESFSAYNISTSIKMNHFEIQSGLMQTEQDKITYSYGISFFYNDDGSSPYLHFSSSKNWMDDKQGKVVYRPPGKPEYSTFDISEKRDLMIGDVGYRLKLNHVSLQASIGFAEGVHSKEKLAGPSPVLQFGIVIPLYKMGSSETANFK